MKKLLILPNQTKLNDVVEYIDGVIFGIKGYSVNTACDVSIEELKNIVNQYPQIEVFVSLNKNMKNKDISEVKKILIKLEELQIKGIFYADTCFINLKKELQLTTDLVWSNEHVTTNYQTIQFWQDYGVKYTYVSAEITLEEIKEIRKNTTSQLIVPIFGHLPMYTSFRHAVQNYKKQFDIKDNSKFYYIEKEGNKYPIIDNELGTTVYSSAVLDGFEELAELDIDYVTLNEFHIDRETFINVLKRYRGEDSSYDLPIDKGFLYKETVYRVKK